MIEIKSTQEYVISFFKAPITTLQNHDLDFTGALILLGLLPFSVFLAVWSLLNRLIGTMVTTVTSSFGGLGALLMPNATNMRAEMMASINWGGLFFGVLFIVATWFALMMFMPVLITKMMKNIETICLKELFTQLVAMTIPMAVLFLVATVLGFVGLPLWAMPVVVAVVVPILLHLFIIGMTWNLGSDKTTYIVLATQVVAVIVVGLLAIHLFTNVGGSMLDGMFW